MRGTDIAKNTDRFDLRLLFTTLLTLASLSTTGCYAPLLSPGIPASELPDSFRTPMRACMPRLNLAELTIPHESGSVAEGDLLEIRVHGLEEGATAPIQVRVLEDGSITLPLVGTVDVAGKRLPEVQKEIGSAYEDGGLLKTAKVAVQIAEPAMVEIVVVGQVNKPGVYAMPRNTADVGRAIALAGGLTEVAGDMVEVHRNARTDGTAADSANTSPEQPVTAARPVIRGQTPPASQRSPWTSPAVRQSSVPAKPGKTGRELGTQQHKKPASGLLWKASSPVGEPPMVPRAAATEPAETRAKPERTSAPAVPALRALPPAGVTTSGKRAIEQAAAVPLITHYEPDEDVAPGVDEPAKAGKVAASQQQQAWTLPPSEIRIPLRGFDIRGLDPDEVRLRDGDVVRIPKRRDSVFYVVGPLSTNSRQAFNVSNRDLREIGGGLLLPMDRDIDVVTGVAMAGYIDPITSPTTVTVQRKKPNGESMLINVDLIAARSDSKETILLRPDDIVYLNPDGAWWTRRFFDQVAPQIFTLPYRFWIQDLIVPSASPL